MQLLHLLPGRSARPLLPAAVSAHRAAADVDAVLGLAEHGQPIGGAPASACKGPKAVRRALPERAVRRFVFAANLRVHLAGVRQDMVDTLLDRLVDQTRGLPVAVEPEQHALVAEP